MDKLKRIIFSIYTGFLLLPLSVFAQSGSGSTPGCPPGKLCNPIAYDNMGDFLTALLDVMVQIAFPIIVLAIIYTGFLFVVAQGNKDKLEDAKKAFLWTIIGALIVLGAAVLSKAIQGTINQIRGSTEAPYVKLVELSEYHNGYIETL